MYQIQQIYEILIMSIPVCLCNINVKFEKKKVFARYSDVYTSLI